MLAVPELFSGEARRRLLLRYGDLVASLGGTYRTAADMNNSAADMDVVAERCRYVYGRSAGRGGAGDSGWGTARGVFHGIRASLEHVFGSEEFGWDRPALEQKLDAIGTTLREISTRADTDGINTEQAAGRLAASHLTAPGSTQ